MGAPSYPRIEIDGHAATAARLGFRALFNYGHFTAMQVRRDRVRGLRLHLERLDAATTELFGTGLDGPTCRPSTGLSSPTPSASLRSDGSTT
jgi:hypothetical protein